MEKTAVCGTCYREKPIEHFYKLGMGWQKNCYPVEHLQVLHARASVEYGSRSCVLRCGVG